MLVVQIYAECTQAAAGRVLGLATAPERMQRVHTLILLLLPVEDATRTLCRLGNQRLLDLLWAWLTLFPVAGFLPHIAHILAIVKTPLLFS